MNFDLTDKTVGQLENIVRNYRDQSKTDAPIFIEALRELELRRGRGLDLQKTLTAVTEAARAKRFVPYREIAEINGFEWPKIHWEIGDHLLSLCEYAHRKGLPLLSAIVVNAEHIKTGDMNPESRAGFISAATQLGFDVGDEKRFVADQQAKVFAWAAGVKP